MDHPAAAERTPAHRAARSESVLDGETVGLPASGHPGRPFAGRVADPPSDDSSDDSPDLMADSPADPSADSASHAQSLSQRRPFTQCDSFAQCDPLA